MTNQVAVAPSLNDGEVEFYAWLRRMRDDQPVWFDETANAWKVFRYHDAVRTLSDHAAFSNDLARVFPPQRFTEGNVAMMDPPQHRAIRHLVSQAFTPGMVTRLEPRITEITNDLLDAMDGRAEIDLIHDLANPLPVMVVAELLGVPLRDRELFQSWAEASMSFAGKDVTDADFVRRHDEAQQELRDYLLPLVRERSARPRDDLISRLVGAQADGHRLTHQETVNFAGLLLIAGHITTTLTLGNTMLCLDENPAARSAVRADPALLPAAVEEAMRYRSAFVMNLRVAARDIELGGQTIPAGHLVMTSLASANRDERQFAEPDRYEPRRDPNPHLGFGHGIHYCLGAPLARLETRIALRALLDRYPGVRGVPGTTVRFHETIGICGVRALPLTLAPVSG